MFRLRFSFALMMAVVITGCAHDCFVVEITPQGERFERRLTCWHVQTVSEDGKTREEIQPLSKEQLARLGKLYERRETADDAKKHVFVGSFSGQTPADVGGAGSYTHFRSNLGTLSVYVERFRGDDDPEATLARRRAAADQLVDLVVGWFESEVGDEPNFRQLRRFLDKELRHDVKNLGVYMWAGHLASRYKSGADAEFWIRAGQYLVERDFFRPAELPQLARAAVTDDADFVLKRLQRIAARKLGVPDDKPPPKSLAFMDNLEELERSWDRYVRSTEYFQKRLRQHEAKSAGQESPPESPTPKDVSAELVGEAVLFFDLTLASDALEVKLHCSHEPFDTNGKWDADKHVVNWSSEISENDSLPPFCNAVWSTPNQEVQRKHFGKTVLADAELAQYVLWYRGLRAAERKQWDDFVADLTPGDKLITAIESFQFTGGRSADGGGRVNPPPNLAEPVRHLLLGGLQPE